MFAMTQNIYNSLITFTLLIRMFDRHCSTQQGKAISTEGNIQKASNKLQRPVLRCTYLAMFALYWRNCVQIYVFMVCVT